MTDRMTPAQAWEGYVGSQTPQEFMEVSAQKGLADDWAVHEYVKDLPAMFGQSYTDDELIEIAGLLLAYIRQTLR